MKNQILLSVFLVSTLTFLLAGTASAEKTVIDPTGRSVRIPDRPMRIIALAANITEIVFAPIWVWLVFAEMPSVATLLGGAIVLGAIGYEAYRRFSDATARS